MNYLLQFVKCWRIFIPIGCPRRLLNVSFEITRCRCSRAADVEEMLKEQRDVCAGLGHSKAGLRQPLPNKAASTKRRFWETVPRVAFFF